MSSGEGGEKPLRRKPKVSWAGLIPQGQPGAKADRKAQPMHDRQTTRAGAGMPRPMGREDTRAGFWTSRESAARGGPRNPVPTHPETRDEPHGGVADSILLLEKSLGSAHAARTKTDTGG